MKTIAIAGANQVEQIIYLGGIILRKDGVISLHLRSRLEIENVLRSRSTWE